MKIILYILSIISLLLSCGCPISDPTPKLVNIMSLCVSNDYIVPTFCNGHGNRTTTFLLQRIGNNVETLDCVNLNIIGALPYIDDKYFYGVKGDANLAIFDISNSNFDLISDTPMNAGRIGAVKVLDNYAYIVNDSGLFKANISDKTHPAVVDYIDVPQLRFRDLILSDNIAYLLDDYYGLYTLSISDPAMSILSCAKDYDNTGYAYRIAVSDNKAYITVNFFDYENLLFYAKLLIYDVSNPALPNLLCNYYDNNWETWSLGGITVVDNYTYIEGPLGLYIYDVSNPNSPLFVTKYTIPNYGDIILVQDNYLYLGICEFIYILDITNPTSPQLVVKIKNPAL